MNDKPNKTGFRVGDYFVSFPEDEFIKEDPDSGGMYVLVDIYKLDRDNNAFKLEQDEITTEIESLVNSEINKMLTAAMTELQDKDK
jgi:hypothetical protein